MSYYKDLNKELVEQVQSMRISLQEHREEIISLRAKCMNYHDSLVFIRKKCKDLALLNCQRYLEVLEPDSDVLRQLQGQQIEILTPPVHSRRREQSETDRNSARLASENRRSSSLIQTRRSFNSTSPIRNSSCIELPPDDTESDEESEAEPVLESNDVILEEDEEADSDGEEDIAPTNTGPNTLCQDEDDESGTDTNTEENSAANESNTSGRTTRTLREITNTLAPSSTAANESTKKKSTLKSNDQRSQRDENRVTVSRGRIERKIHLNAKTIRDEEKRNKSQENLSDSEHWLRNRTVRSNDSCNGVSFDDNEYADSPEEPIEAVRHMSARQPQSVESFYAEGEEVIASSYVLSEETLQRLHNAPSSTPRQEQHTKKSSPNNSDRPKRNCRPKSLIEPGIRSKLRNETNQPSLSVKKKVTK